MMKLKLILAFISVVLITETFALSKYCSGTSNIEFRKVFDNCSAIKSKIDETALGRYEELLNLLDRVSFALKLESNTAKDETKRLVLDLVQIITILNTDGTAKFCMRGAVCNLFKNCELPMEIQYSDWNNDAIVAARIAALLTSYTNNERLTNSTYLSKLTLFSLLRSAVADNANIYDAKIVFRLGASADRLAFEAFKDHNEKKIKVRNVLSIFENTKNFYWYYKWMNEVKLINLTKSEVEWSDEFNDIKPDINAKQIELVNPTALYLNKNFRFVSGVTYDCISAIWNRIVSVPFMYSNGEIRGVVAVSISLNNFDLKQCGNNDLPEEYEIEENLDLEAELIKQPSSHHNSSKEIEDITDPFYGTDKCDPITTQCENIGGRGFVRGSYVCKCRDGYYYPKSKQFAGFDGIELEHYYSNRSPVKIHDFAPEFKCKKCSKGCETCNDSTECETEVSKTFKQTALAINLTCILICIILAILMWYHMTLKVLKTSSPKMLFMVLLGAIISYMEIIPMFFEPSLYTCIAAQVLQLEGFLMAYGALVLKTWRECKLFYVRSVKTIKITDRSLFKRLLIILLIGATFLAAWTGMQNRPNKEYRRDANNLRYETCSVTFWNFISMAIQLVILLWGAVLSFQVRRASIAFKETKLITWAIFNEGVVCCFVISVTVLLQYTNVSCYVPFILNFIRMHLAITVMLLLLFSYKVYTIILARKKPMHATQSSGLLNSFSVSSTKDGDHQNISIAEETDKEREMRDEIAKLYRQIEEMRSLSMRIANPHLIPKKGNRFMSYQAKKFKASKSKVNINEMSKIHNDNESQFLTEPKSKLELDSETSISAQTVKFKLKP